MSGMIYWTRAALVCAMAAVAGASFPAAAALDLNVADAATAKNIMLTNPDYVVFVPKQPMQMFQKTDPHEIGDCYNDHFQVLHDDARGLYYAFWTQASWEGAGDHHIVFSKSADGGKTWTEAVTLAGSERRAYKRMGASWQQPMLSKSGRLYCYWNQKVRQGGCSELLYGFYSDDGGDTWSEPEPVCGGSPPHLLRASNGVIVCSYGWRRSDGFGQRVMFSRDEGATWDTDWIIRDDADSADLGYPCTVQLDDGSMFTVYYQHVNGCRNASLMYSRWQLPEAYR